MAYDEMKTPIVLTLLMLVSSAPPFSSAQSRLHDQADPLTGRAEGLVSLLVKDEFTEATATFDETLKRVLPASELQNAWMSTFGQVSPFRERLGVRKEKILQYDVVFITCRFEKGVGDIKIVFNSRKQITGLFFELFASYVSPGAFVETEIRVGGWFMTLPGTLTIPRGAGPFPAVVLVHGSGPQDRDESVGPNKPFRDLAWGLASRGVAVLRYEKRTKVFPMQTALMLNTFTVKEETIDDALAAVALLRKIDKIDPDRIFVLGHSLGGMVVPRIGMCDTQIAGLIVLAGAARPMEDALIDQFTYIFSLDGMISGDEQAILKRLKSQVAKVKDPRLADSDVSSTDLPLGIPKAYWLDLRGYNPAEAAKDLPQPMLILQGGRDYQVTQEDFRLWTNTLSARHNVTCRYYEGLNHLFIEGEGKSAPSEYDMPGHVAPVVIDDIACWIRDSCVTGKQATTSRPAK
jgi:hypothetical protein